MTKVATLHRHVFALLCCFIFASLPLAAQPVLTFSPVITSLSSPVDVVHAGDGTNRIFIVQQSGTIRVYDQNFNSLGNFLTVSGISTGGERGLLSLAFSPSYSSNGFFYVYYTNSSGDIEIARYQVSANPNVANAASKVVVITIPHPTNSNHNGGKLNFGNDGYLYFATGDGGSGGDPPNNAQNGNVLLGKMLRIAVNNAATPPYYTIPPSNPYVSNPSVADEIWAMGLRNPFRWSFDRLTHDMWIGDVGQDGQEEINFTAASSTGGENYGWRCYEGSAAYNTSGCGASSGYQFPVFTYPNPPAGSAAVTGGIVYRGSTYPALQGYYLAADVYSANVYLIRSNGAGGFITYTQTGLPGSLVGFGETENGEALAVSIVGTVYSISVSSVLPVVLSLFNAQVTAANDVKLLWKTTSEENTHHFEIEYSTTAAAFQPAGSVIASGARDGASYQFTHIINASGRIYYRLKIVDDNGSYRYSNVVAVTINRTKNTFVYPSLITTGVINIYTDQLFQWAQVVNMNGVVVLKKNISGTVGKIEIPVISLSPGTYVVQLYGDVVSSQKIIIQ